MATTIDLRDKLAGSVTTATATATVAVSVYLLLSSTGTHKWVEMTSELCNYTVWIWIFDVSEYAQAAGTHTMVFVILSRMARISYIGF